MGWGWGGGGLGGCLQGANVCRAWETPALFASGREGRGRASCSLPRPRSPHVLCPQLLSAPSSQKLRSPPPSCRFCSRNMNWAAAVCWALLPLRPQRDHRPQAGNGTSVQSLGENRELADPTEQRTQVSLSQNGSCSVSRRLLLINETVVIKNKKMQEM